MFNRNFAYGASAAAILLATASAAFAQETTGGIRGLVTDAAGNPVANANVTVTHAPSGTSVNTVTGADGFYSARSLRVGGPYTVSVVSSAGQQSSVVPAIGIGAPVSADLVLGGDAALEVSDVIVTGARSLRTSPSSRLNLNDLETLPSIGRDIKDVVRTTPFATVDPTNNDALSIGGQNTRLNAILIDGIRQGDDFGLNGNGYPTLNSPISRSVLQAVSVDVAPYGVQYGAFQGGVVNSVTKSGGNDFAGELFWETTNDSLRGDSFSYEDFVTGQRQNRTVSGDFEKTTWGATISGPILRDRLFFLLNYELDEAVEPVLSGPSGSNAVNQAAGITQADVDRVREISRRVYGFDPLDWSAEQLEVRDEKFFGKLDWNITDRHRAVASYQQTKGSDLRLNGTTTNGNFPSVGLLSMAYNIEQNLTAYKGQVFSDWTDTFSTEFAISYKEVENISESLGGNDFAAMQVYLATPTSSAGRSIRFGPERSRHANALTTETTQYRLVGNWEGLAGHRFTAGFEREEQDIFNLYVQFANGEYEFASIDDFENRRASAIGLSSAASNDKNDAAAAFAYAQNSLYIQDEWRPIPELTVTAGLRYDWYTSDDKPLFNQDFNDRFGFTNTTNMDGLAVLQPRVAFNWRTDNDLTVYGGFGRFQGGSPNVWVSNSFTNPGNLQGTFQCKRSGYASQYAPSANCTAAQLGALDNVDGFNPSQIAKDGVTASANAGTGNINLIDPAFRLPSIWKTSLGVNKTFDLTRFNMGEGWGVTAEYVHSELEDAIGWVDLSMNETVTGQAPDGRPIHGPNPVRSGQYVLMMTNFQGGKTDQIAVALNKDWYDGWLDGLGFNLSYTWLDSTDRSPATSSTAHSSYSNNALFEPNNPTLATSNYEIEHALKLNLSYSRAFFGDYRTRINMYAQRRSGLPFSYTYGTSSTTLFGDAYNTQRHLLYVPKADTSGNVTATSDPLVRYGGSFDVAQFNEFLHRTGLIKYNGEISPRNAFRSPYVTTVDLHISQELPAFFPGGAKLIGYMDIENLGNLLNDEWGTIQQIGFPYTSNNVGASISGGQYVYNNFNTRSPSTFGSQSVWQVKFGVRYSF